jgi:hypothetical protein
VEKKLTMSNYIIKVSMYDPYPKEWEVRANASSVHTAIARALKELRQGPLKKKRIKEITIKATKI